MLAIDVSGEPWNRVGIRTGLSFCAIPPQTTVFRAEMYLFTFLSSFWRTDRWLWALPI